MMPILPTWWAYKQDAVLQINLKAYQLVSVRIVSLNLYILWEISKAVVFIKAGFINGTNMHVAAFYTNTLVRK